MSNAFVFLGPILFMLGCFPGPNSDTVDRSADLSEQNEKLGITLILESSVCNIDAVVELVEKGADVDFFGEARNSFPQSPLEVAVAGGCPEVVTLLIDKGAQVNSRGAEYSATLLHQAAGLGHEQIVRSLVNAGIDVNSKDGGGNTALMWAAEAGQLHAVNALLELGARVNERDYSGRTAVDRSRSQVKQTLIAYGGISGTK